MFAMKLAGWYAVDVFIDAAAIVLVLDIEGVLFTVEAGDCSTLAAFGLNSWCPCDRVVFCGAPLGRLG